MQESRWAESGGKEMESAVLCSVRCCEQLEMVLWSLGSAVLVQVESMSYSKRTLQQFTDMFSVLKLEHNDCHLAYEELRSEYQRLQTEMQEVKTERDEATGRCEAVGADVAAEGD
eukprot:77021-Hanusia_phi.AAC.1